MNRFFTDILTSVRHHTKKYILWLFGVLILGSTTVFAVAPSFYQDYAEPLINGEEDIEGNVDSVYDIGIRYDQSLYANIRYLFYPDITGQGGKLWDYVRVIGVGIFFVFLVWIGVNFLIYSDDESKLSETRWRVISLAYGAVIYFGAVWVLGVWLRLTMWWGTEALVESTQNQIFFQALSFFKAFAFFGAIIALVYAGFKMMYAMDEEDQIAQARTGIVNVIIALVLIKVIDFIFLIAQSSDFVWQAQTLIISISRVMAYVVGIGLMVSIFVAGYLYITDGGTGENVKKAKNIFLTVFFVGLTIFLFLLVLFQLIATFG